jgi:hypothetical protein
LRYKDTTKCAEYKRKTGFSLFQKRIIYDNEYVLSCVMIELIMYHERVKSCIMDLAAHEHDAVCSKLSLWAIDAQGFLFLSL